MSLAKSGSRQEPGERLSIVRAGSHRLAGSLRLRWHSNYKELELKMRAPAGVRNRPKAEQLDELFGLLQDHLNDTGFTVRPAPLAKTRNRRANRK